MLSCQWRCWRWSCRPYLQQSCYGEDDFILPLHCRRRGGEDKIPIPTNLAWRDMTRSIWEGTGFAWHPLRTYNQELVYPLKILTGDICKLMYEWSKKCMYKTKERGGTDKYNETCDEWIKIAVNCLNSSLNLSTTTHKSILANFSNIKVQIVSVIFYIFHACMS